MWLCLCMTLLVLAGCGQKEVNNAETVQTDEFTSTEAVQTEAATNTETVQAETTPNTEAAQTEETTNKETTETEAPTEAPEEPVPDPTQATEVKEPQTTGDYIIETPYYDLHFPNEWKDFLVTETTDGTPYTVAFYANLDTRDEQQKLYTVSFGGSADTAAAAVKASDGKYIALNVENVTFVPDSSWTSRDINIVFTMQETLNYVLEKLPLEDADLLNSPAQSGSTSGSGELPESMKSDLAVDTPYMELHYPSKWADNLSIKVKDGKVYSVTYACIIGSHNETELFTIYFGGKKGVPLKTIKTEDGDKVEIRINVPELSLDGWSEDERNTAFAMQEDLNYLLLKLD